jgi:hypothetical protein
LVETLEEKEKKTMADGAGAAPARQLLPFRNNTRQKRAIVNNAMAYSLGGTQQVALPTIGYLAKMFLRFNGTITFSGAAAAAKFAPYSIFQNIKVDLNSQKQTIIDVSGYQLYLLDSVKRKNARLDQNTDSDFYVFPSSGSAQTFRVTLELPIAVSDGMNFQNGLINLQAPEIQATLQVRFVSALTDIADTCTAITGTVDVIYEYYEVPDPTAVMQPPQVLHKVLSMSEPLSGVGENIHQVPRGGRLLRLIHILECNGAKSDAWDTREIRLNYSQSIYFDQRWEAKHIARQLYGFTLPTGSIVWDFVNSYDQAEESDLRDVLNTEVITTLESKVIVTSGTTLGTNNNFLHSVREILQVPQG